jgi:superfamily II DNA or RNA helicase
VDLNGDINMDKSKKDLIQERIEKTIVLHNCRGIILSSVRSGKTKMLLESIRKHSKGKEVTIFLAYPNVDIKTSWENEMNRINYHPKMIYSTFVSLEKNMEQEADYYIFDEAHLIPEEHKLPIAGEMAKKYKHVIFASGTYTTSTLADITINTSLPLIVDYSTEQAIEDGIISDYTIYIHQYELDPVTKRQFISGKRKWWNTDVGELDRLTKRVENTYGDKKMLAALSRMRFINTNKSLALNVMRWIRMNPDKRFIIFTENQEFGKQFKIPMFNSKSVDDTILKQFQDGTINQLCLIKKGSAGVTYPNLDNILITSINSNGENLEQMLGRALLTDTEHSDIHIFVTSRPFQLNWLNSALSNIPEEKIVWLKSSEIFAKTT